MYQSRTTTVLSVMGPGGIYVHFQNKVQKIIQTFHDADDGVLDGLWFLTAESDIQSVDHHQKTTWWSQSDAQDRTLRGIRGRLYRLNGPGRDICVFKGDNVFSMSQHHSLLRSLTTHSGLCLHMANPQHNLLNSLKVFCIIFWIVYKSHSVIVRETTEPNGCDKGSGSRSKVDHVRKGNSMGSI